MAMSWPYSMIIQVLLCHQNDAHSRSDLERMNERVK